MTMTESPDELFSQIWHIHTQTGHLSERYHLLDQLIVRTVKNHTAGFSADFTNFSSRLHTLCRTTGCPSRPLEIFRAHVHRIETKQYDANEKDYLYDLKAVCDSIARFCQAQIPANLQTILPTHWRSPAKSDRASSIIKRLRLTVYEWDSSFIYGQSPEQPELQDLKVCYASQEDAPFANLKTQLYKGAQVNLLNVKTKEKNNELILNPEMIILNPDFLIDITALCACIKPYGRSCYTHLINKFAPAARSAAIQLGNVANLFLDECIYENTEDCSISERELYLRAIRKSFQDNPLEYATLSDIDKEFFTQCETQFHSIRETIHHKFSAADIDIESTNVQLEPSFLCESLGLQGRMDLLTNALDKLIELKSGKAEEFPSVRPREEHQLQMALYKEILYFNMGRNLHDVQSYLFYSRYPRFYAIDVTRHNIQQAMALRNEIVTLEHQICNGHSRDIFNELDETHLNVSGRADRFYFEYLRPQIMQTLIPFKNMTPLESAYFHTFLTFMEREQFLAKIGDDRPDSSHGFAEAWNADTSTKQENGNILTDLTLHPITDEYGVVVQLLMELPEYKEDFLPSFRLGDMVMLYERQHETDHVCNRQFFRCLIEEITPEHFLLRLTYKQRHADIFHTDCRYAIEPSYSDGPFRQAYAGLLSLLKAPKERKELILGQRKPETDNTIHLNNHYLNEEIDRIVLQAKQAKDYFLLIGPPGTGKTSVALKSMVQEFMSDQPAKTILLMAYTNRAVDEICEMLSTISPQPKYVRIGQELNCDKSFRPHLLKNVIQGAANRNEIYERLAPIRLFVGTINSLCGRMELFNLKPIDVAIIDEASQVIEPQLLPLLCATTNAHSGDYRLRRSAISKFILIGDHKQLPAVVTQPTEYSRVTNDLLNEIGLTDCRNSFFERLHNLQKKWNLEYTTAMLHKQGRMHPALSDFVNQHFYGGHLDIVPVPHQLEELEFTICQNDPWQQYIAHTRTGFLNITGIPTSGHDKCNRREADIVVKLIKAIAELCRLNDMAYDFEHRIGVIVPFRSQIAMINRLLAEQQIPEYDHITVDTVERYQGSQRDIILFSTTINQTYQLSMLSEPTFTDNQWIDRKLNVALTRAKKQFFLIGNGELLARSQAYKELLDYMNH